MVFPLYNTEKSIPPNIHKKRIAHFCVILFLLLLSLTTSAYTGVFLFRLIPGWVILRIL